MVPKRQLVGTHAFRGVQLAWTVGVKELTRSVIYLLEDLLVEIWELGKRGRYFGEVGWLFGILDTAVVNWNGLAS